MTYWKDLSTEMKDIVVQQYEAANPKNAAKESKSRAYEIIVANWWDIYQTTTWGKQLEFKLQSRVLKSNLREVLPSWVTRWFK